MDEDEGAKQQNVNISKDVEQKSRFLLILARKWRKKLMRILEVNFHESKKC